jgi:hypothetical protein
MQKLNKLIKILFTFLLCIVMINAQAQTGLNFQGVARTSNNIILASQSVSLRLSILQGSSTGVAEYVETRRVTTNAQGLFTVVIGDTGSISTLGNFSTINWKNTPKFLKIEMDPAAGNNFITMGTTQFQYVAYAQFAKSVDAENISGVMPVVKGGTGANSLSTFKTALALDKVNNTADTDKPISAKTQTALALKLNAEDTSKYAKQIWADSALLTKINSSDTIKYVKKTYADSSLLTKLRITDTAAMLSNRIGKDTLNLSARINAKANTSDLTTSLALKENASNKSSATDLGGLSPSDELYPTQKAVKAYVTANASSGGMADGGISTAKLADGAVTDAKLGTGISKSKVGLGNVENISINTWAGTSSLTTVGTITSGTWSGTAISLNNGGTGATNALAARANLGLVIGTNVQAPLTAGTDYLTPTGSASGLTNFPTLNQNTTGNAATASKLETARNINGVSFDGSGDIIITSAADAGTLTGTTLNSTITGSSLTSVGTITSGIWSGTALSVEKGGTGATTASAARTNLGLEIGTNVQATLVAGTGINIDNNTNSISTIQNISITSSPTLRSLSLSNGVDPQFVNNSNQIIFGWNANPFGRNNDGTIEYAHAIKTRHNSLSSLGNNIDFFTWDPANDYSSTSIGNKHIMTIQGDGKVGIGKQVPLKSLDVVGDIQTTGNLIAGTVVYPNTVGSNNQVLTSFTNGTIGWSNFTQGQADAGTLTGTTLNSTITGSSLTSVGRIANLSTGAIINSGKVIVGATSAASSSAVLEASSTTQGFLPPRMSASQRNAISYPATGLIIFCNNCSINGQMQYFNGTAWVDMVGNATASVYNPTVGSSYQGGIVAYILVSGDPGYDATTTHGLIAATEDQSSGIQWCNNCSAGSPSPPRTGATGSEIGSGLTNTNKIIAIQGETSTSYAAGLARAYTGGGYNDWYLPSKDELEKLYLNRALIGGFSNSYWSSTDDDDTPTSRALAQNFGTTFVFRNFYNKFNNFSVRAIRSF